MLVTPSQGASRAKPLRVLHIDDDPDAREIVSMAIGCDASYSLHSCTSGEEALAAAAAWSPDLVLLDVLMPDMDGPTTLSRLRKQPQTSGVPVIYVSGRAKVDCFESSEAMGFAGFISKPFDPMTLRTEINTVMLQAYRTLAIAKRTIEDEAELARAIIESSEDAIIAKNLDGTILSWNNGAERMFQYRAREAIGRNIRMLIPESLRAQEEFIMGEIVGGRPVDHFDTVRLDKNGRAVDVSLHVSPIYDQSGKLVGVSKVGRDISGRLRAAAELDRVQQRLSWVVRDMSLGIWDWNIVDNTLYWSDRFKEMMGFDPGFASNYQEFASRLHPEDHDHTVAMVNAHIQRRERYDVEYRLRKSNGDYLWLHAVGQAVWDADGQPLRMVGSVEDLTQRKRAEERFRRVVEAAPAAMVMADQAERIALVNRQTEKLFGYARGELLGQSIELLMPKHQRNHHPDQVRRYFASPDLHVSERPMGTGRELSGLRKDGSEFPVEIGLTPIQTDEGMMVLGAIVDITLRKQSEEVSRQFNQRLEQQVALRTAQLEAANDALDEFAYAASHDLKAPLRVIENASRWLEEDLAPHLNGDTREYMQLLRGRVARLEKLLDDLLQFSRVGRETCVPEIISGQEVVDNVLALLSPPARFTVDVDPRFASITVVRMPLQQILMNLIGNAIKHHDKPVGRVEVTVEDRGAYHAFAVSDDGPGIPAQFHDKIFQMFQTLKPRDQVEGSGMGLAIVRKRIDLSGGSLTLESAQGQGSTFRFTLPAPDQTG